jgi:hypothetical protein
MKVYKHFEGEYIPYRKKEELELLHKMSNYTACGALFDLKLGIKLTDHQSKVTCPECLKEIKKQKDKDNIKYNKIYIRS